MIEYIGRMIATFHASLCPSKNPCHDHTEAQEFRDNTPHPMTRKSMLFSTRYI